MDSLLVVFPVTFVSVLLILLGIQALAKLRRKGREDTIGNYAKTVFGVSMAIALAIVIAALVTAVCFFRLLPRQ